VTQLPTEGSETTTATATAGGTESGAPSAVHLALTEALRGVVDPELGENVVDLGMVRSLTVSGRKVTVELALTIAGCPLRTQLHDDVERVALSVEEIDEVAVVIATMDRDERAAVMSRARRMAQEHPVTTEIAETVRIIGIVSGKGGVGKSSVTVNLAAALAARGATVGLLDADIWGFSVPRMLGVEGPLEVRGNKIVPITQSVGGGLLKIVSMGFLSGEDEAIMWRGLVLNRAVQHFIEDVAWGDLDYLLIDMPPGTGDVQMGLARMLPRTELIVVTTPALAAQKVAGRAADMARKGHLRVAGVIENMAGFTCAHGEHYDLFGSGGGQRLAEETGVPLIGSIPLDPSVASGGDAGRPAASDPTSPLYGVFAALAARVAEEITPKREMSGCSARLVDALDAAVHAG
jgi:ATP-binding protein involved in chromosome partitioning